MKVLNILLSLLIVYTTASAQQDSLGKITITGNGDTVTMTKEREPKVTMLNSREVRVETYHPKPLLLNGQPVFYDVTDNNEMDALMATEASKNSTAEYKMLTTMIDSAIDSIKNDLPSGTYSYKLENMTIDTDGSVAYYETDSMQWFKPGYKDCIPLSTLAGSQQPGQRINNIIAATISKMRYTPFIWKGVATPFHSGFSYKFKIGNF